MTITSSQGDSESRFSHLIQPIRDLAKNWDIDIATDLEDYLEELENISITFDDGQTKMNFAEAALLIQGSASIYSKKVEYLYSMVYQVLEMFTKKKKSQKSSLDDQGNDKDADFNQNQDAEEFLALDDIKLNKNTDLKEEEDNISCIPAIPLTPLVLLPLANTNKEPLLSKDGEVLGHKNDYTMNKSVVHGETGAIMLDMMHLSLLEKSLFTKPHSTPFPQKGGHYMQINYSEDPVVAMEIPLTDIEDNYEDEGAPVDISIADDNEENKSSPNRQIGERMEMRKKEKKPCLIPPPSPALDVYAHLDPHQCNKTSEKPFKKAKTFRPPKSLTLNKKRKRGNGNGKVQELTPITEHCITAFHSYSKHFPSHPLRAPAFLEFEHLFWIEYQRRQAVMRKKRQKMLEKGRLRELAEDEENEKNNLEMAAVDNDDDVDDADDYQVPEVNIPEITDIGILGAEVLPTVDSNKTSESIEYEENIVTSYEDLVRQYVDGFMTGAEEYAQTTDLCRRVKEWEEKVIPRLQEEESRESFDIHKYGTQIINKVKQLTKNTETSATIPFAKVVENKPSFEVCRTFLASLQLANTYNIEIIGAEKLEEKTDSMNLRLLSTKRQYEELLNYQAPSLQPPV